MEIYLFPLHPRAGFYHCDDALQLAYCCGGRDWSRLKEITQKVLGLTVGIGAAMTLIIWLGRGPIIGLFIQDETVASLGRHLSTYMILMGPFTGVYYFCTNFLQASGSAA